MGKVRETSTDEETSIIAEPSMVICQKRHKKRKHKRHKRKKTSHEEDEDPSIAAAEGKKSPKVRGKRLDPVDKGIVGGSSKLPQFGSFVGPGPSIVGTTSPRVSAKKKMPKSGKSKESATSSEEERWLDAIESGKLEEVDDELKKIKPKDPKLMTARQRAMFERKTDAEPNPSVERLVSLPSGYKEKVMTAEAIQKAALKSLKRKQLADEKREKDKKKTMERLLKKQESRVSKFAGKGKAWKRQVPFVSYRSNVEGTLISLPPGQEFRLGSKRIKNENSTTANERGCSIAGCENPRRYSCSKTGVPLCSLECYRANLARILT